MEYVSFYWTLPVHWMELYDFPKPGIEEAARLSKTIRYQRERVRRFLALNPGRLLAEVAVMSDRTDRATNLIRCEFEKTARKWPKATVLYVDFSSSARGWRRVPDLSSFLDQHEPRPERLDPEPVWIPGLPYGKRFDPIKHFAQWRRRDEEATDALEAAAHEALREALRETPPGRGQPGRIADRLNRAGVRTVRGKLSGWTARSVNAQLQRHIL